LSWHSATFDPIKQAENMIMAVQNQTTPDQATLWNGTSGCAWVDAQQLLDQVLKPFEDMLMDVIRAGSSSRLLDVGCGTGSTTLAAARLLGEKGQCTGVDISEPMLALARTRAEREHVTAKFICADAQTYAFDAASFDTIISRFGVMFFDDFIQAFANLRRAATNGARLCFIAWRGAEDNPFMTTAERAAAPFVPNIPPRNPDGPGQMAFADPHKVRRILEQSGWREIDIRPVDVVCSFPEPELIGYFTRFGPLGQILNQADAATRNHVITTVRAAFDPYVHGAEVRFNAGCWATHARA
jgi:SAM-dependent methyltransferase